MGNIISVFGILLAVFTYLESLHHNDIEWAKSAPHDVTLKENNTTNIKKVKTVIVSKQIPLLVMSLCITIMMLPETIDIVHQFVSISTESNVEYDISKTVLVFINLYFVYVLLLQANNTVKLRNRLSKLES